MIGVRVKTYEATNEADQAELMRLTIEELGNPAFPKEINVLISKPEKGKSLIVMSIEPTGIKWDWPGEKTNNEDFGRFKTDDRLYIARRP